MRNEVNNISDTVMPMIRNFPREQWSSLSITPMNSPVLIEKMESRVKDSGGEPGRDKTPKCAACGKQGQNLLKCGRVS
jgi:hypothetical protein